MKAVLVSFLLLATSCFANAQIQGDSSQTSSPASPTLEYQSTISIDPLFAIIGCTIFGYEHRMTDRLALEGHVGLGSMLFVDVKTYYELGGRYYLGKDPNRGIFLLGFVNGITLQANAQSASATILFIGAGHRWRPAGWLALELFGGGYFSGDKKNTLTKVDGNTTTSVDVGGTRFSGTLRMGVTF
jgi:hypothetical protein